MRSRVSVFCMTSLCLSCIVLGQKSTPPEKAKKPTGTEVPAVVAQFLNRVGDRPSAETYYEKAKSALWEIYPQNEALKKSLVAFIQSAPDSPGLGFAGLALIPFHDPSTVKPMLERALDRGISQATRWSFLNTAPYILAMGDVMYDGEGNVDRETTKFVK